MRSKVFVVGILAICMCSLALAEVPAGKVKSTVENVYSGATDGDRVAGTVGNVTAIVSQTGPLAADVTVGWDTTPTTSATVYSSYDAFWVYGQIYDSPWIGFCSGTTTGGATWTTTVCNDFIGGYVQYAPGADPTHSYSMPFSFTVPAPDFYQGFGLVYGGWSPGIPWLSGTGQNTGFWITQYNYSGGGANNTEYIDNIQPTDNPDAGGQPIPTMNRWGILAMIGMLLGVAVLVIIRRK